MKRCVLVIPDAGPLESLWVADRLDLLLRHRELPQPRRYAALSRPHPIVLACKYVLDGYLPYAPIPSLKVPSNN